MRAVFHALALIVAGLAPALGFEIEEDRLFPARAAPDAELHILSTTDTEVFAPLIEAFQAQNPGISIRYVVASSQELFRAIAGRELPVDLAISSAMDMQMKLANDGFAAVHRSEATAALPGWARWRDQIFAFTQEPVVLAISRTALAGRPVPRTRGALIELLRAAPGAFVGRIGTYDPRASGAGYLFATQDARQSDTYWRFSEVIGGLSPRLYVSTGAMIDDLRSGRLALAYNVLGSYLAPRLDEWADGEMVELRDYTNVLLRTAFILEDARHPDEARAFLDFLVSDDGQRLIGEKTGLAPIDETALAAAPHLRPIRLDPGLLVYVDPVKRRNFLEEWQAAVIQP